MIGDFMGFLGISPWSSSRPDMSLLPQFTSRGRTSFLALVLGLVFCLLTLIWLTGYAVMVAKAGDVLRRPRTRRVLDGLTGAALLGLGLRLASGQR